MLYRVETNDTRTQASIWYTTEEEATWLCAALNADAYRAGMGGLYGVYNLDGHRVP